MLMTQELLIFALIAGVFEHYANIYIRPYGKQIALSILIHRAD